jgi:hypothetical protein
MRRLPDAGAGPRIGIEGRSVLDAQVARVSSDVEDELPKELTFWSSSVTEPERNQARFSSRSHKAETAKKGLALPQKSCEQHKRVSTSGRSEGRWFKELTSAQTSTTGCFLLGSLREFRLVSSSSSKADKRFFAFPPARRGDSELRLLRRGELRMGETDDTGGWGDEGEEARFELEGRGCWGSPDLSKAEEQLREGVLEGDSSEVAEGRREEEAEEEKSEWGWEGPAGDEAQGREGASSSGLLTVGEGCVLVEEGLFFVGDMELKREETKELIGEEPERDRSKPSEDELEVCWKEFVERYPGRVGWKERWCRSGVQERSRSCRNGMGRWSLLRSLRKRAKIESRNERICHACCLLPSQVPIRIYEVSTLHSASPSQRDGENQK